MNKYLDILIPTSILIFIGFGLHMIYSESQLAAGVIIVIAGLVMLGRV